ncbi:hypothetical protein SBA2_810023 [Acidobacteriia bacterium SbA2]|nr:hypothetical protein SBA2_810023 [Acidobacteriia bacterium SbA2]
MFTFLLASTAFAVQKPSVPHRPSKSLSQMIDLVRETVVQVAVVLDNPGTQIPEDLGLRLYFDNGKYVLGTGFFVNEDGDVITAAHVSMATAQTIHKLQERRINSQLHVCLPYPNSESERVKSIHNFVEFSYHPIAVDAVHDVSILSPVGRSPFQGLRPLLTGRGTENVSRLKPKVAQMYNARPGDGDEVFACGFPVGDNALNTTTGHIATAWGEENIAIVPIGGISKKSEVYKLDLRVNLGNSGGPVFLSANQTVIGIVHGFTGGAPGEGTALIVPTHYIIDILKQNGRSWRPSTSGGQN